MRKAILTIALLTILFTACSPPIAGDAGTYAEPTRNVWGETMAAEIEQLERAKATREAR